MLLSIIDQTSKYENKQHGRNDFPYIVYYSAIPQYIHGYPMHWHDEMEIIYVQKGSCIVTINKSSHRVVSGDIILILPGMLHAIDSYKNNECQYFNIVFDLRLLGSDSPLDVCFTKYLKPYMTGQSGLPHVVSGDYPLYDQLTDHLSQLSKHLTDHCDGLELFIKAHLFEIFWLLKPLEQKKEPGLTENYHHTQIQKMKDLIRFITIHFDNRITLKDAADFCGYSTSYFMKFFKSFTGATFVEYLNNYRLKMAGEYLLTTDLSILEISEKSGFENHSYFIRLFKKYYGTTPFQYRRAGQKN